MHPKSYVSNIHHFLTPDGHLIETLPSAAHRLATHLCRLIEVGSGPLRHTDADVVACWNRIGRKKCRGEVYPWVEDTVVRWQCAECRANGEIHDWQGTRFDRSALRAEETIRYEAAGIWLNGLRLDELQMSQGDERSVSSNVRISYPSSRIKATVDEGGHRVAVRLPSPLALQLFYIGLLTGNEDEMYTLKVGSTIYENIELELIVCPPNTYGEEVVLRFLRTIK